MTTGFFYLAFILSAMFFVLGFEKIYYIFIKKDNLYIKYDFTRGVVLGLATLDLFGAIAIWLAYDLIGMLGLLAMGGSCLGSIFYNFINNNLRRSFLSIAGLLSVIAIFLEFLILK